MAAGIEQDFNSTVASTMSSLMAVASASLIIPATVRFPSSLGHTAS
jgi:Ca2+:H+ antiporter